MICEFDDKIFNITALDFNDMALELFRFQYQHNELYRRYTDTLHTDPASVKLVEQIPFLPISFFKSHAVITGQFEAEVILKAVVPHKPSTAATWSKTWTSTGGVSERLSNSFMDRRATGAYWHCCPPTSKDNIPPWC